MAIYRKDGSAFKLNGPNPLMGEQDFWEKPVVHNFSPLEITTSSSSTPKTKEEIRQIEIEEKLEEMTTKVHILPALIEMKVDPLYGETKKVVKYDRKQSGEAIIQDQNDLHLKLIINADLSPESIIYCDRRWWTVISCAKYNNNYLLECSPSTVQPSF